MSLRWLKTSHRTDSQEWPDDPPLWGLDRLGVPGQDHLQGATGRDLQPWGTESCEGKPYTQMLHPLTRNQILHNWSQENSMCIFLLSFYLQLELSLTVRKNISWNSSTYKWIKIIYFFSFSQSVSSVYIALWTYIMLVCVPLWVCVVCRCRLTWRSTPAMWMPWERCVSWMPSELVALTRRSSSTRLPPQNCMARCKKSHRRKQHHSTQGPHMVRPSGAPY